jgi:hypothetical protein
VSRELDIGLFVSLGKLKDDYAWQRHRVAFHSWVVSGVKPSSVYVIARQGTAETLAKEFGFNYVSSGVEVLGETNIPHVGYKDTPMLDALFAFAKQKNHDITCFLNSDNIFVPDFLYGVDWIMSKFPNSGLVYRRTTFGKGNNPGDKINPLITIKDTLFAADKTTDEIYRHCLEHVKLPKAIKYPDGGPKDTSGADCMIFPTKIIGNHRVPRSIRGVCYDTNIIIGFMRAHCNRIYLPDIDFRLLHAHHKHLWGTADPEWVYNQQLYFKCEYFIGVPPCRPPGIYEVKYDKELNV